MPTEPISRKRPLPEGEETAEGSDAIQRPWGAQSRKRKKDLILSTPIEHQQCIYVGNFDLFAMSLPFLVNIYLPGGVGPPQYQALYHKLLVLQAKLNCTARCYLAPPSDPAAITATEGRFHSATIIDPLSGRPFEIRIEGLKASGGIKLRDNDLMFIVGAEWMSDGRGTYGRAALARKQTGIRTSRGFFKMKRVWGPIRAPPNGCMELFVGVFSFTVLYEKEWIKSGRCENGFYKYAFWAIRSGGDSDGRLGSELRTETS